MLSNPLLWLTGLGELSHELAMLDLDGTIVECNKAWRKHAEQLGPEYTGWTKGANLLEDFASARYPADTKAQVVAAWRATLADVKTSNTVTYLCTAVTPNKWFTITFKQFRADQRSYVLVTHVDVSAAKRREDVRNKQLTASKRMALFAEHTDRAVMILNRAGRIDWINPGFTQLLGYSFEEVRGRSCDVLLGPDSDPHVSRLIEHRIRAGVGVDTEVLHYCKNGQSLWIRSEIRPVKDASGQVEQFVALEVDITDLKLAHAALARDRELLTSIVNALPHMIAWKDHDLVFRGCNERYARAVGLESTDDIVGRKAADLPTLTKLAPDIEELDQQVIETAAPVLNTKYEWQLPTGKPVIVNVNRMPLRIDSTLTNGVLIMTADVTEDERVAKLLRENEERWKRALEVNDVGVWEYSIGTHKLICSPRWHEIMRVDPGTAEVPAFPEYLVHPDDVPKVQLEWRELLEGRVETLEMATRMKVGDAYRLIKVRARVVERDAAGTALRVVGTNADIHDARQQQMQSANARKLEAIGQLASGIAHEINTPTQYVGDNVRFLGDAFDAMCKCISAIETLYQGPSGSLSAAELRKQMEIADMAYLREEIPKAISQALGGIERIARIVGAMKEFSHPGQERSLTDINRAIANTITVATNEWKYVAKVETEFDATMPLVPLVAGEFNQVILNILVNAAHAIGDTLGQDTSRMGTIKVVTRHTSDCAEVLISDDGCGMPHEIQERIFDPFFTTKPVGKGTGQGLAIAHNVIVSKHGGTITVKSQPGKGTTFEIRLPLVQQDRAEIAA